MSRSFSAVVLIGMSGVGKTTNAERYGERTTWEEARLKMRESGDFLYISADDNIAAFLSKDLLEMERGRSKEPIFGAAMREPVDLLAGFVGQFGGEKHGGLPRQRFFERQERYRCLERADWASLPALLESAYMKEPPLPDPILYDTTGSFCEVVEKGDELCKKISGHAIIVYLECSDEEEKILLERQLVRPKPMVYNRGCFEEWLSDYQRLESVKEEDIDPDDFLRFIFPKAIQHRRACYESLADVTLSTADLEALPQGKTSATFAEAFVNLVEENLSSDESSRFAHARR